MNKEEKHSKIKELFNEQKRLVKKAVAVAKLPEAKRPITAIKRAQKVVMLMIYARKLEVQKQMLIGYYIEYLYKKYGELIQNSFTHGASPDPYEVYVERKLRLKIELLDKE